MSGSAPAMRVAWTAVAVGVSIEPCRCGSECKRVIAEMGNRRARGVNQGLPLDAIAACAYTRRTVGSRGLLQKRSTWALLTNQCSLEVESAAACASKTSRRCRWEWMKKRAVRALRTAGS